MSKKYAYIYDIYGEGYWTGFASIEEALAAARERELTEMCSGSFEIG